MKKKVFPSTLELEMRVKVGGGGAGAASKSSDNSGIVADASTTTTTMAIDDFANADESSPLRGARGRLGSSSSQAELSPGRG